MTPRGIFIAAQPKSGSTHLLWSITRYLEAIGICPVHCGCNMHLQHGIEAQDIAPWLIERQVEAAAEGQVIVWKQHMMPTPNNLQFLRHFGIHTIVTTRDVADSLQSLYDHFDRWAQTPRREEEGMELRFAMPIGIPLHISDWERMEAYDRRCLLEALYGPWFAWFKAAWLRQREIPTLMLGYDFICGKPMEAIAQFLGVRYDAELAAKAFDKKDPMWNVGASGRGQETFGSYHDPGLGWQAWETLERLGQEILRLERAQLGRDAAPDAGGASAVVSDVHPPGVQGPGVGVEDVWDVEDV